MLPIRCQFLPRSRPLLLLRAAAAQGEEVLCGSAGFMRLMGIMVPQKLADKSAVFIAVS